MTGRAASRSDSSTENMEEQMPKQGMHNNDYQDSDVPRGDNKHK
jgi:hypothetical protein